MIQDLIYRDTYPGSEAAMKRACDRLVRSLIDAGLLEAGMVWYKAQSGYDYPYRFVSLTAQGAKELERAEKTVRFKSSRRDRGQDSIRHELEINRFYVALHRACTQSGIRICLWQDDRQLAALEKTDTRMENIPDAFFVLEREGSFYTHFLELDRGTETVISPLKRPTDMLTKYRRYGSHIKERFLEAPYFEGLPLPIILTITTAGNTRLKNLIDAASEAKGEGSYWFTNTDTLYSDTFASTFWKECWQNPKDASYRSLLTRLHL